MRVRIDSPEAMEACAAAMSRCLGAEPSSPSPQPGAAPSEPPPEAAVRRLYLQGELGAGKTTFVRGLLRGLGYQGLVKSPTYALVEPYEAGGRRLYHFDLYRLAAPEELEALGGRDYFAEGGLCLVEWPERAAGVLPPPDLLLRLSLAGTRRELDCEARTPAGERCLAGCALLLGTNESTGPLAGCFTL